jgi:hypothetical protein
MVPGRQITGGVMDPMTGRGSVTSCRSKQSCPAPAPDSPWGAQRDGQEPDEARPWPSQAASLASMPFVPEMMPGLCHDEAEA